MMEWKPIESAPKDGTRVRGQIVHSHRERLLAKVSKDEATGCWNWTGAVRSKDKPYGRLTIGSRTNGTRRQIGAHQLSYMTFVGPIPEGFCVCHKCDNPRCINPDHLFAGTWKDNSDDRDRKGRLSPAPIYRGERHPSAKLTKAQVDALRKDPRSSTEIAAELPISDSQVRAIRRGEHYPTPPEQS